MRIRILLLGVTAWTLARSVRPRFTLTSGALRNTPGFDNPENTSGAMAVFDGYLYVVTRNLGGAEVWEVCCSGRWREVTPSWPAATTRALALTVFGGRLYVGTDVGEVWRTAGDLSVRPCVPVIFRPGCLPGPGLPRIVDLEQGHADRQELAGHRDHLAGRLRRPSLPGRQRAPRDLAGG